MQQDLANIWRRRQQFEGTDHPGFRIQNLTTTQRDALTGDGAAKAGDAIWNTTQAAINCYDGSAWQIVDVPSAVGTVTTTATTAVEEYGNGIEHLTKLTMTAFNLGNTADNAALGFGANFYSFPAGTIIVTDATMVGSLTANISVKTNTPEIGIGTVVASGAVSVLSGTATFEDIIDGNASGTGGDTVAPDVNGTAFYKSSSFTNNILIKTTGGKSRNLFLNAAATWVDVAAAGALTFTGVITLKWSKVS